MIEAHYLDALRQICDRMRDAPVDWAITGSLGMALQGVDVRVRDIDVQSDQPGVYEIERRLCERVVQPVRESVSERVRSHFGELGMGTVTVEIFGAVQKRRHDGTWEEPVDVTAHRRWVSTAGMRVPVLALEYECEAYLKLGRRDRADLIMRAIEKGRAGAPAAG